MKRKGLLIVITLLVALFIYLWVVLQVKPPKIDDKSSLNLSVEQIGDSIWVCNDSWLKHNDVGLWELYVTGSPFELGVKAGKLTQDLNYYQEKTFVDQLRKLIPSETYLNKLKYFVAFFNRNLEHYIPVENQKEIFGYSLFASDDFSFIAPNYQRMLNYHGAHDIGHAMQNMNLVACTAFAAWGSRTSDSSMIIARNFDFYMGDDFAKNKIVAFYKPDNGIPFMMITWAGMTGVVSGMNMQGLTITLNAAKSEIPLSAKTPVSILARQILQHAKNIDEAYEIAKNTKTFVSESLLIGSANDKKVVVIEKSPTKIDIYETWKNEIVLTNHFQGDEFIHSVLTQENIKESPSMYRYQRVQELMAQYPKLNVNTMAAILRDPWGKNNKNIGLGNEKAVNQFIAHHGIIFKPQQRRVWIATQPYQMGKFVMYDLGEIFSVDHDLVGRNYDAHNTIPADPFLTTDEYADFQVYRMLAEKYKIDTIPINKQEIIDFIQLNKRFFQAYGIAGEKYLQINDTSAALRCYNAALQCELPHLADQRKLNEYIEKLSGSPKK